MTDNGNGEVNLTTTNISIIDGALSESSTNAIQNRAVYNALNNIDISKSWPDGAAAHNSISRGKDLGTSVTSEQWANISNGTFKDLFPGDYWTIGGVKWIIGECDRYLHCGKDEELTKHHLVMFPAGSLYNAQMTNSPSGSWNGNYDTTANGYAGSDMRTTNLENAKTTISNAFGSNHIITYKQTFTNAVSGGNATNGAWYDATVELMSESMVYGAPIFRSGASTSDNVYYRYTIDKTQLAAFRNDPSLICIRTWWWLRDVVSSAYFAAVDGDGNCNSGRASGPGAVRPCFLIG